MYPVYSLVAHPQSAELAQPGQGSLDNPPLYAQPTAMPGAPFGDHRRYRIHQRQQLSRVMTVGSGHNCRQRSPVGAGDHVAYSRACGSPQDWSRFFRLQPPGPSHCPHRPGTSSERQLLAVWTTGVHGEPATLRLRATLSGGASGHPEPYSIPLGNISQEMPLLSTKRMPVTAFRTSIRRRLAYRNRLGFAGGGSGWNISHSSSLAIGFAAGLSLPRCRGCACRLQPTAWRESRHLAPAR